MIQSVYVANRCSEIDNTIQYAANKSANDPDLGAHLAGYISVLISGVVEDCIEHYVVERARKTNDTHVIEFVQTSIDQQFRNPKSDAIATVLKRFGTDYSQSYQKAVTQQAKEALSSVVNNRLSLAHQGTSRSNFTVNDVRGYFSQIVVLLEEVETILM